MRTLEAWLQHAERVHPRDIELGLERVASVAESLGVLRPAPRAVIVAGTNGKGSTCVALEALLLQTGLTVGTTLSPHVERFNERVRINARECDDATLCAAFAAVESARGLVPLTYFEFSALVALLCFVNAGVDVAILEVGLGGRLDAMNIVSADVAVITSIGLDHQAWLGHDIEQIGAEKAGVLRAEQKVVLGSAVTASVVDHAADLNCQVHRAESEFKVRRGPESWTYQAGATDLKGIPYGALADVNWALAITAAGLLGAVDGAAVARAVRSTALPGRFERVRWRGRTVILDVAHNPAGAEFLSAELQQHYPGARGVVVLGMLADKDPAGCARALAGFARAWVCVGVAGSRGMAARALAERLPGDVSIHVADDLGAALAEARSRTSGSDVILVCGSFAVVESARRMLHHTEVVTTNE